MYNALCMTKTGQTMEKSDSVKQYDTVGRPDLKSMSIEELKGLLTDMGEKSFRASQLFKWMHSELESDIDHMTDLPKSLREKLKETCTYTVIKQVREQVSKIDGTRKYLWELDDGNRIESVRMGYRHGSSVCISSQAGCAMGCAFCASAIGGLDRSLTPAEMLEQVYRISAIDGERVKNVVVMGSGEPFANTDNLIKFLRLINDEKGLGMSLRNVTVSTCGIVPEMYRFAQEGLPVTLAVSLHAPDDTIRKKLMPVASKYPYDTLMKACKDYFEKTGRRITFEYALINGVNDSLECADMLAKKIKNLNCHVNIININPIKERLFTKTGEKQAEVFRKKLEKNLINVTIRRALGQDIDGACGQLRRRFPYNESSSDH